MRDAYSLYNQRAKDRRNRRATPATGRRRQNGQDNGRRVHREKTEAEADSWKPKRRAVANRRSNITKKQPKQNAKDAPFRKSILSFEQSRFI